MGEGGESRVGVRGPRWGRGGGSLGCGCDNCLDLNPFPVRRNR